MERVYCHPAETTRCVDQQDHTMLQEYRHYWADILHQHPSCRPTINDLSQARALQGQLDQTIPHPRESQDLSTRCCCSTGCTHQHHVYPGISDCYGSFDCCCAGWRVCCCRHGRDGGAHVQAHTERQHVHIVAICNTPVNYIIMYTDIVVL